MKQIGIRLDDEVIKKLQEAAQEERRSVADYVRGLILEDLDHREENK